MSQSTLMQWLERFLGDPATDAPAPASRTAGAEVRHTVCGLCACGCGVEAQVAEGRVLFLEGDPANPINQGTLCAKGAAAGGLPVHPDRALRPRVRRAGTDFWETSTWDEALATIADRLMALRDDSWEGSVGRADALAFLGGAVGTNEEAYLFKKLATLLGALGIESPARGSQAPSGLGLGASFGYGAATNPSNDLANARVLLVQGSNPAETHPMAMRWILEAKAQGARLIVVDPRFTRTAAHADEFVPLRPGTDIAFLGALIKQVIERGYADEASLREHTNAGYLVHPDFAFEDGHFTGLKRKGDGSREYDPATWSYLLGTSGEPRQGAALRDEGTVFWHLTQHFSRYDLKTAEGITGVRAEQIERVAELLGSIRPGAVMVGLGATQHTVGTQQVRAAAILQLLLGNMGVPGGGLAANHSPANLQGACDMAVAWDQLPGGLPVPGQWHSTLDEYRRVHGREAHRGLVNLLRAWFSPRLALPEAYQLLPRLPRTPRYSTHELLDRMREGEVRGLVVMGQNPVVSVAHRELTLRSLAALDLLVVMDLFETETTSFWRQFHDPTEVPTEVWQLPVASFLEKPGTVTNSGRWVQGRDPVVEPPGEARPDLWVLDQLFRRLRARAEARPRPRDKALLQAAWDYGEAEYPRVLAEIAGVARTPVEHQGETLAPGEPLPGGAWLRDDGRTACGNQLYAGLLAGGEDRSRRRGAPDEEDVAGTHEGWAWCWPENLRILYPRSHPQPFAGTAEGVARLFAAEYGRREGGELIRRSTRPVDGPLPEHYEPFEGPLTNPLHPTVPVAPLVVHPRSEDGAALGEGEDFPFVLTTGSLHEMAGGGAMTRRLASLVESQPEPFVEISRSLGNRLGVSGGERVLLVTARGQAALRVVVTGRLRPLYCDGGFVEVVWAPTHWGEVGDSTGASVHAVTLDVLEPNVKIPETKSCRCRLERLEAEGP